MLLNHFKFDIIWTEFQLFLKLNSRMTVLSCFCRISVISQFSFVGVGLKTKTQKPRKMFIFFNFFFSGYIKWIFEFCVYISFFSGR